MRIFKQLAIILVISTLLTGCASTKKFNVETGSPVAVISIFVNDEITWYREDDEPSSLLGTFTKKMVDIEGTDDAKLLLSRTIPFVEGAEEAIFEGFSEAGIEVIPKDEVLNSNAYLSNEGNEFYKVSGVICPNGYKFFDITNNKVRTEMTEETGAVSYVYITYEINKVMDKGIGKNGKVTACVTTTIRLTDSEGKNAVIKTGFAEGEDSIAIVAGIYDLQELSDMIPDIIKASLKNAVNKL